MYEIQYNSDVKKFGVFRSAPYMSSKLLCAVFDRYEDALEYVVRTINKTCKIDERLFL